MIVRVNPEDGMPAPSNPLGYKYGESNTSIPDGFDNTSFSRYFAYGIRNSFGLTVDPITGKLWDTENGKDQYDEINLVDPGFNSGWRKVMGPISRTNVSESDLVNFYGSQYSDPEFSWNHTIGVTDLEFYNSSKLGEKYTNNLFVGDYHTGNLYFFQIDKNRNGISINDTQTGLSDLVADNANETSKVVLGTGFDVITDIQTGPDEDLYILSYSEYSRDHPANVSRIYKIVPST